MYDEKNKALDKLNCVRKQRRLCIIDSAIKYLNVITAYATIGCLEITLYTGGLLTSILMKDRFYV